MSKALEGKVAVVSGSGQGIGRAVAIAFAEQGARVITNNRKPGSTGSQTVTDEQVSSLPTDKKEWFIKGLAAESGDAATTAQTICDMGGEATPVFCDIAILEDAKRLIQTAVDTYGRIDILCNIAGGFGYSAIEDLSPASWDHVNNIKPRGYFYTMKYAIPYMKKQNFGRILLCSSPAAFTGGSLKYSQYVTASAAVVGLTRAAALELYADGITVNCFAPGAMTRASFESEAAMLAYDSPITIEGRPTIDRLSTPGPEYVAPFIVYLASERAARISGSSFFLVGNRIGMYAKPTFEKMFEKKSKEPWSYDEIVETAESELIPDYKSICE